MNVREISNGKMSKGELTVDRKTYRPILFLLWLGMLFAALPAVATWPLGLTGDAEVHIEDMATSATSGYSYVVGRAAGPFEIEGEAVCAYEGASIFLVKVAPWGNVAWSECITGADVDEGLRVTVDTDGNAYLAGTFHRGLRVGEIFPVELSEEGSGGDLFIVRFDGENGRPDWAARAGGLGVDGAYALTHRPASLDPPAPAEILVGGTGTCDVDFFDEGETQPIGDAVRLSGSCWNARPLIAAVDTNGSWLWATEVESDAVGPAGGDDRNRIVDLAADSEHIYATGAFYGNLSFPRPETLPEFTLTNGLFELDDRGFELEGGARWGPDFRSHSAPLALGLGGGLDLESQYWAQVSGLEIRDKLVVEFYHAFRAQVTHNSAGNDTDLPDWVCEHGAWLEYKPSDSDFWRKVTNQEIHEGKYNKYWDDYQVVGSGTPSSEMEAWCEASLNFPDLGKVRVEIPRPSNSATAELDFRWSFGTDPLDRGPVDEWIIDDVRICDGECTDSTTLFEQRFEALWIDTEGFDLNEGYGWLGDYLHRGSDLPALKLERIEDNSDYWAQVSNLAVAGTSLFVEFKHAFYAQTDDLDGYASQSNSGNCEDGAWLEYRLSASEPWQKVVYDHFEEGAYNDAWDDYPISGETAPSEDRVWCDSSPGFPDFDQVRLEIPQPLGGWDGSMDLRWRYVTDGNTALNAPEQQVWVIDDVVICDGPCTSDYGNALFYQDFGAPSLETEGLVFTDESRWHAERSRWGVAPPAIRLQDIEFSSSYEAQVSDLEVTDSLIVEFSHAFYAETDDLEDYASQDDSPDRICEDGAWVEYKLSASSDWLRVGNDQIEIGKYATFWDDDSAEGVPDSDWEWPVWCGRSPGFPKLEKVRIAIDRPDGSDTDMDFRWRFSTDSNLASNAPQEEEWILDDVRICDGSCSEGNIRFEQDFGDEALAPAHFVAKLDRSSQRWSAAEKLGRGVKVRRSTLDAAGDLALAGVEGSEVWIQKRAGADLDVLWEATPGSGSGESVVADTDNNLFLVALTDELTLYRFGPEGTETVSATVDAAISGPLFLTRAENDLQLAGTFEENVTFGDRSLSAHGDRRNGFIAQLDTAGNWYELPDGGEQFFVGEAIDPPGVAAVSGDFVLPPEFYFDGEEISETEDIFLWSPPAANGGTAKLYPLRETPEYPVIEIRWRVNGQDPTSEQRVNQSVRLSWPGGPCAPSETPSEPCYQWHVAGAPAELALVGRSHFRTIRGEGSDAAVEVEVFNATADGYSTIILVEDETPDIQSRPVLIQAVQTGAWPDLLPGEAPIFSDGAECQIGREILSDTHEQEGRSGAVLQARAFFDPESYSRQDRTGQIFAVNRQVCDRADAECPTADQEREMRVAWYRPGALGAYWPDHAIEYDCEWPEGELPVLRVAGEDGSDSLGHVPLPTTNYPQATLYVQNDPEQPGYNPNDEHALLLPARDGSDGQELFALRADFRNLSSDDPTAFASDPYALVRYNDPDGQGVAFEVVKVESGELSIVFNLVAPEPIAPPYPLNLFATCPETEVVGERSDRTQPPPLPFYRDTNDQLWARAAGDGEVRYFYPRASTWSYDLDNDRHSEDVDCVPLLAEPPVSAEEPRVPQKVTYSVTWPTDAPVLVVGETLLKPKRGLPDIFNQAAAKVIYDQLRDGTETSSPATDFNQTLAQLVDPLSPRTACAAPLVAVPGNPTTYVCPAGNDLPREDLATRLNADGKTVIVGDATGEVVLSPTLQARLYYDPLTNKYVFRGIFDESGVGEPLLLPNVMSRAERDVLLSLSDTEDWQSAIREIFALARNPNGIEEICTDIGDDPENPCLSSRQVTDDDILIGFEDRLGPDSDLDGAPNADGLLEPFDALGINAALTAGAAQGEGFITLAFNDRKELSLPVSLEILKVGCLEDPESEQESPHIGQIHVIEPSNIFDEQLTLRHSNDFGGRWEDLDFEWLYHPDEDGTPPDPPPVDWEPLPVGGWQRVPGPSGSSLPATPGLVETTVSGASPRTLSDNWYLVRYQGLPVCGNETRWSIFGGQPGSTAADPQAQLALGWVKRVISALNPFDARVAAFHTAPTNTFASMIAQLGERYEGPIALSDSPDNLNEIGLIEAYQTVLRRARELSIDAQPWVSDESTNAALLNISSRLADFYMLLGNEAFADALDPTIGITTSSEEHGFGSLAPTLFNFQNQEASLLEEELVLLRGRDGSRAPVTAPPVYNRLFWNFTQGQGEVAYALSYNVSDQNADGFINEFDARKLFPQGHGDAWGHYLTAIESYSQLLRHPNYTWNPRPEAVPVAGAPVQIDYLDERKFARAAAARARVGAEIVDLTYRHEYVEDPAGQWQGYKDTDEERAWGLSGWGRRAGMGAYLDWVTGNAVLPEEDADPEHVGIQKIDRRTVIDLDEIVTHYLDIQNQVDEADRGLNPLGLAKGVVPFDLDPSQVNAGKTHFEQIHDRAVVALDNAVRVWDYANELQRMLRFDQDEIDDLTRNSLERELDFKGRLIEIFGSPYEDDIGAGGTYPLGYDGPDLYHYFYVDLPALHGTPFAMDPLTGQPEGCNEPTDGACQQYGRIKTVTAKYRPIRGLGSFFSCGENVAEPFECSHPFGRGSQNVPCGSISGCGLGDTPDIEMEVENVYWQLPNTSDFALTKPPQWTGVRPATGKIQEALNEITNAQIALRKTLEEYELLRLELANAVGTIQGVFNIRAEQIRIMNEERIDLNLLTFGSQYYQNLAIVYRRVAAFQGKNFDSIKECLPKVTGFSNDLTAQIRCAVEAGADQLEFALETVADASEIAGNIIESTQQEVSLQAAIEVAFADARLEQLQDAGDILDMVSREPVLRTELFARAQMVEQAKQGYRSALSEGLRILSQLQTFRKRTAVEVQDVRHRDMAFRIFRNDALQKYRAAFDTAARYTYLAAAAYDYDTNLLGTDARAGQGFLTDIVRQRSLGQVIDGEPVPGSPGLADALGRMRLNFDVLKGQMGFNNPQIETNRFSLRDEAFRFQDDTVIELLDDAEWRAKLLEFHHDDLWEVPEFRRYARPFALETQGPQPGLVIPFESQVNFGMNFFGEPLAGGDSAYDPTQFSTRIRSVGVWLDGYDTTELSNTPRVYLLPVGADILRPPTSGDLDIRTWSVVDQRLPVPFPIGYGDLEDPEWTPLTDMLNGSFGEPRRYGSFRAYPLSEPFDETQLVPDSRLVGRSVWNTRWLLIIPGGTLLNDPAAGLEALIGTETDPGIDDIRIFFETYAYQGF